jgi:uncharacterized membrane protein
MSLGSFGFIVLVGWMIISYLITKAILKGDEEKFKNADFFEKIELGIKSLIVYLFVFFVPIYLLFSFIG